VTRHRDCESDLAVAGFSPASGPQIVCSAGLFRASIESIFLPDDAGADAHRP
jgi:hypothetical protein